MVLQKGQKLEHSLPSVVTLNLGEKNIRVPSNLLEMQTFHYFPIKQAKIQILWCERIFQN